MDFSQGSGRPAGAKVGGGAALPGVERLRRSVAPWPVALVILWVTSGCATTRIPDLAVRTAGKDVVLAP